ncbi:MAG: type II toxin-antitoxin system HicB family antitoxin [Armatimonadetes bacterium]|nr:type II toxin-antitoxin system HicB family antitoxin [Armatimonadota bacterium]MCX7968111.1 type II toxin-antitoxin system HicB family antitoxin [Armatimonadota bacterium]MDW8143227.1 type II toxin-antitoxin system HicB family antitoxin [Armatimonadota bacterium]
MHKRGKFVAERLADREGIILILRDADGYLVTEVPELQSCYTRARSRDELMARIEEAVLLCSEDADEMIVAAKELVGVQKHRLASGR